MKEAVMALLAFGILTGFLVILVIYVPRWDLISVVTATLVLAAIDTFASLREKRQTDDLQS